MITITSTTCYMISGPESFEQGRIAPGLICPMWEVKYAIGFHSYTHVFAASCSHRDSTAKIQEARATVLAKTESAKLPTIGKTKSS